MVRGSWFVVRRGRPKGRPVVGILFTNQSGICKTPVTHWHERAALRDGPYRKRACRIRDKPFFYHFLFFFLDAKSPPAWMTLTTTMRMMIVASMTSGRNRW